MDKGQSLITVIQNVGFPIAISVYLLVRMEAKLDKLSNCILALAKSIDAK